MNELNPLLFVKLWAHKGCDLLNSIEFLAGVEQEFKNTLLTKMKLEVYLQGDTIVSQGDLAQCAYTVCL